MANIETSFSSLSLHSRVIVILCFFSPHYEATEIKALCVLSVEEKIYWLITHKDRAHDGRVKKWNFSFESRLEEEELWIKVNFFIWIVIFMLVMCFVGHSHVSERKRDTNIIVKFYPESGHEGNGREAPNSGFFNGILSMFNSSVCVCGFSFKLFHHFTASLALSHSHRACVWGCCWVTIFELGGVRAVCLT